jgi:protein-tyrosine phosphatase
MARLAVSDGIEVTACTPHIFQGVYNNAGPDIRRRVDGLAAALENAGISLGLEVGADVHLAPDLSASLKSGLVPTLGGTRYFLLEPPHDVAPPRLEKFTFGLLSLGYVPVLTHPERLRWIEDHFDLIVRLHDSGVLIQLTADSITGSFGSRIQYWADRMLAEKLVDVVASDAHDPVRRPPRMSAARDRIARSCSDATAIRLVAENPLAILQNVVPSRLRQPADFD